MIEWSIEAAGAGPGSVDMHLGARVQRRRHELHLPAAVAADRLGVPEALLRAWEAGAARPTPSELLALAGLLGAAPSWFFEGAVLPAPPVRRASGAEPQRRREIADTLRALAPLAPPAVRARAEALADTLDGIGDAAIRLAVTTTLRYIAARAPRL